MLENSFQLQESRKQHEIRSHIVKSGPKYTVSGFLSFAHAWAVACRYSMEAQRPRLQDPAQLGTLQVELAPLSVLFIW